MVKKGSFFILLCLIACIAGRSAYQSSLQASTIPPSDYQTQNVTDSNTKQDVWITVFVHGSISYLLRKIDINTLINIAQDQVEGTVYQRTNELIRQEPFFRSAQPLQDMGLQPIDKTISAPGMAASALANILDHVDMWSTGRTHENNLYYTFGWDGLVSDSQRLKNARILYDQLFHEIQRLQALGIQRPKIRIYTFSHGGSVTLLLSTVHASKPIQEQISIDELVLLGAPLHPEMNKQITSPLFHHIYNFYSPADRVQNLDLTQGSFSHALFAPHHGTLPDTLMQIKLVITRNRTTSRTWPQEHDPRYHFERPSILYGSSDLLRHASPGHTELWFFQWVNNNYRDNFPLAPLPTITLMPLILDAVQKHVPAHEKNCTVDIRPDQNVLIIKTKTGFTVTKLFTQQQFKQLTAMALAYRTTKSSHTSFDEQGRLAFAQAQQEKKLREMNAQAAA